MASSTRCNSKFLLYNLFVSYYVAIENLCDFFLYIQVSLGYWINDFDPASKKIE